MRKLKEQYYEDRLSEFIEYTLPAMVANQDAPSYGWDGDFTKKSYLEFIDRLYGECAYAEEYIRKEIANYITSYFSREEIEEAIDYYGYEDGMTWLVEEVYKNLTLDDIIDFFLRKVARDMASGKINVEQYFDRYVFDFYDEEDYKNWKREREKK